jgi:predicted phage tail protein
MDFSPGALFASLVVSTVGMALFLYGKKQGRGPQLLAGGLLMVCPYFAGGALATCGVGALVLAALGVALRVGM